MLQFPIFTQHFPFPVCKSEALHLRFNSLPLTTFSFPTPTNQAIAQWKRKSFYIAFINTALFLSFGNKVMAGKHRELYRGLCAYPAANSPTFGSPELFERSKLNPHEPRVISMPDFAPTLRWEYQYSPTGTTRLPMPFLPVCEAGGAADIFNSAQASGFLSKLFKAILPLKRGKEDCIGTTISTGQESSSDAGTVLTNTGKKQWDLGKDQTSLPLHLLRIAFLFWR